MRVCSASARRSCVRIVAMAMIGAALVLVGPGRAVPADAAADGTLRITGLLDGDTPVLAGAVVRIDGVDAGVTNENGSHAISARAGTRESHGGRSSNSAISCWCSRCITATAGERIFIYPGCPPIFKGDVA